MEENQPNKKDGIKWLALINIPIQMGAIVFAFAYLGKWLDETYPHPKIYFSKLLIIIGVFLALYNVYRQVNQINESK